MNSNETQHYLFQVCCYPLSFAFPISLRLGLNSLSVPRFPLPPAVRRSILGVKTTFYAHIGWFKSCFRGIYSLMSRKFGICFQCIQILEIEQSKCAKCLNVISAQNGLQFQCRSACIHLVNVHMRLTYRLAYILIY